MIDRRRLSELGRVEIAGIDREGLVELQDVQIDRALPDLLRMETYLERIQNPYCFLCGKTPVKLSFAAEGDELAEILKRYFIALKNS